MESSAVLREGTANFDYFISTWDWFMVAFFMASLIVLILSTGQVTIIGDTIYFELTSGLFTFVCIMIYFVLFQQWTTSNRTEYPTCKLNIHSVHSFK